jgi:hypothetical protein
MEQVGYISWGIQNLSSQTEEPALCKFATAFPHGLELEWTSSFGYLCSFYANFPRSAYIHIGDERQLGIQNMIHIARWPAFDDKLYINHAIKAIR